jgi:phosphopantothenoylcysteine decarboxylase/phosphopantothenate--cysteine ligase
LAGRRIVVTAGGTREPLDPIRFITNRSSGKMGYAIAWAGRDRGAEVTLIATTAVLGDLVGVDLVVAPDVGRLRDAVLSACSTPAILIMAAAVSDFRPSAMTTEKIKKDLRGLLLHHPRSRLRTAYSTRSPRPLSS